MRQDYYVYLHRRMSDGRIFYVGKGSDKRAKDTLHRNIVWKNIFAKHGRSIEFCQVGMVENDAHLLEMWLIAKLRHEGVFLANMTDGGEGLSGMIAANSIGIYRSDGVYFESMAKAASSIGRDPSSLKSAMRSGRCQCGEYSWSFVQGEFKEFVPTSVARARSKKKKPLHCSNGMVFDSTASAARWAKTTIGNLTKAATGKAKTCMGYTWSYLPVVIENQFGGIRAKRVLMDDIVEFSSLTAAKNWLSHNGWPKASAASISKTCQGIQSQSYGHTWRFIDEQ